MRIIEKAKKLFADTGLSFPIIPGELANCLQQQGDWHFASRKTIISPYNLFQYVREVDEDNPDDYVLLAHAGHGANSYALSYYLVYGNLEMFLQLSWGGIYTDNAMSLAKIKACFSLADKIIPLAQASTALGEENRMRIVASGLYGGYWWVPKMARPDTNYNQRIPEDILSEAHCWLQQHHQTK